MEVKAKKKKVKISFKMKNKFIPQKKGNLVSHFK